MDRDAKGRFQARARGDGVTDKLIRDCWIALEESQQGWSDEDLIAGVCDWLGCTPDEVVNGCKPTPAADERAGR